MTLFNSMRFGLLGHPVSHSLSPKLHNAVFKALSLPHYYELFDVLPEKLEDWMRDFFEKEIAGLSVTIPHKKTVMEFCDQLTERALKIGAVNTIIKQTDEQGETVLLGENTDYLGFEKSLLEASGFNDLPKGSKALVLGSGGAAQAVVSVLKDGGFEVHLATRNAASQEVQNMAEDKDLRVFSYPELDVDQGYHIIVNTTPVGMKKNGILPTMNEVLLVDEQWYRADCLYVDIIYAPKVTPFLQRASQAGASIVTGDRMFLWQAVEQAKLFTGQKDVPVEMMERLLADAS